MHVLRADKYIRSSSSSDCIMQIYKGRADGDLVARVTGHQRQEFPEKCRSLFGSLIHLPIGSDEFLTRHGMSPFLRNYFQRTIWRHGESAATRARRIIQT